MGKKTKKTKFVKATEEVIQRKDEQKKQEGGTPKKSKGKEKNDINVAEEHHMENPQENELENEVQVNSFESAEQDNAESDWGETSGISVEQELPETVTEINLSVSQDQPWNPNADSFVPNSANREHFVSSSYHQNAERQNVGGHSKYYKSSGLENREITTSRAKNEERNYQKDYKRGHQGGYGEKNFYSRNRGRGFQEKNYTDNWNNTGYKGRGRNQQPAHYQAREESAEKPNTTNQETVWEDWDNPVHEIPHPQGQAPKEDMTYDYKRSNKTNTPRDYGEKNVHTRNAGRGNPNRWNEKQSGEKKFRDNWDNSGYKGRGRNQEPAQNQAREESKGPPAEEPNITNPETVWEDWNDEISNTPSEPPKEDINEISSLKKLDLSDENTWEEDAAWSDGFRKVEKKKDPRMEREKLNKSDTTNERANQRSNWRRSEGGASNNQRRITNDYHNTSVDSEIRDKKFDEWDKIWHKIEFTVIKEIEGNLFDQPKDVSLAHCVAEDLRMGSGIAVDFKREFKNVPDLLDQRAKQGGLATLHDEKNKRFVYYLVTKRESNGKPTYATLFKSLWKMRDHIKENQVQKLAVPRLGCGLDRLEWDKVKSMMEFIFKQTDVEITVCNFQQSEDLIPTIPKKSFNTCKLVMEDSKPITEIEPNTLIMYFSTETGEADEIMLKLDKKFNFMRNFNEKRPKVLGGIIYYDKNLNHGLCGCIVRKTSKELFSFASLGKCIAEFNKMNQKLMKKYRAFEYVAYQWVNEDDYKDSLINQKIITVLINLLRNVDVYVCRGCFRE